MYAAVALAATVLSNAVPIEAPTCWDALTAAEATPACQGSTPRVPTLNAVIIAQPIPRPVKISAVRMSTTYRSRDRDAPKVRCRRQQRVTQEPESLAVEDGATSGWPMSCSQTSKRRHRQEGQTGSQRGIAEHDLKVVGEKKKDSKHADDRERCGQTATTAIALANDSQRQ